MNYSTLLNSVSSQMRDVSKQASANRLRREAAPTPEKPARGDGTENTLNKIGLEVQRQGGT